MLVPAAIGAGYSLVALDMWALSGPTLPRIALQIHRLQGFALASVHVLDLTYRSMVPLACVSLQTFLHSLAGHGSLWGPCSFPIKPRS